jgi:hypothetical protein
MTDLSVLAILAVCKKETAPCYSHGAVIYVGDDPAAALRAGSTLPHTFACSAIGPAGLKSARSIPQTTLLAAPWEPQIPRLRSG